MKSSITLKVTAILLLAVFTADCQKEKEAPAAKVEGGGKIPASAWTGSWAFNTVMTERCDGKTTGAEVQQLVEIQQTAKGLVIRGPKNTFHEIPGPIGRASRAFKKPFNPDRMKSFSFEQQMKINAEQGTCVALKWTNVVASIGDDGNFIDGTIVLGFVAGKGGPCDGKIAEQYQPDCLTILDLKGKRREQGRRPTPEGATAPTSGP